MTWPRALRETFLRPGWIISAAILLFLEAMALRRLALILGLKSVLLGPLTGGMLPLMTWILFDRPTWGGPGGWRGRKRSLLLLPVLASESNSEAGGDGYGGMDWK